MVLSLLDIWAPQTEVKGKGKEEEKVRKTTFGITA